MLTKVLPSASNGSRMFIALASLLGLAAAVVFHASAASAIRAEDSSGRQIVLAAGDDRAPGLAAPAPGVRVSETYGRLPRYFEANRGQIDQEIKFLSRGRGHVLFLTPTEAVLVLAKVQPREKSEQRAPRRKADDRGKATRSVIRLGFVGANREPDLEGQEELPGKANYFIGNDPKKWRTNVPTYAKVQYRDLYPGINLVYYDNRRRMEFDFLLAPGANPNLIRLEVKGADRLDVDARGDLVLHARGGQLRLQKPAVYQEVKGIRQEVSGRYVLTDSYQIGFQLGAYDATRPVIIDPVLFYSTYLGGGGDDVGNSIAVDESGDAYVTGQIDSTNFPTTPGAFQATSMGGGDAFVTKLNATGSGLVYSTYLGGSNFDAGRGIAVDASGNAYVTGGTASTDFPTTPGAFQTTPSGGGDAFVTKLNSTGSLLLYSTYLHGADGESIAVDAAGNAYVTGDADSTNFPTTTGAFQTASGGALDAFVTKLNQTGTALVYSTYLGGSGSDVGRGIAVDTAGSAYVAGFTGSTNFPTSLGAFQTTYGGGTDDAFVTKVNLLGSGLVYSTYLGGSDFDASGGIAVDAAGNAYVTGGTRSTNFPTTTGAFQTTAGGADDAFVTKMNPLGTALVYSTYLGGSGSDGGQSVAVDSSGNAYVTGGTDSTNFPMTADAFQPTFSGGPEDAYVAKLDPTGSALVYSTYLGGSGDDIGFGIALDALPQPDAYVTGTTSSTNFPITPRAFQPAFGGGPEDAFVAKITEGPVPPGQTMERVTGGGTINVVGGIGSFSFIVQRAASTGALSGRLQYFNHASGAQVQSQSISSLMIIGNTATFGGTCTVNGTSCTFTVNVTDNGEPGTTDTFAISVSGGPTEGGTLRGGNILIAQ